MFLGCIRLLASGPARPQRVKRGGLFIRRTLPCRKVAVEEPTTSSVAKKLTPRRSTRLRALHPLLRILLASQNARYRFEVLLHFIEQAVQTNGGKMMRAGAVRTRSKTDIKSRFPHCPVTSEYNLASKRLYYAL